MGMMKVLCKDNCGFDDELIIGKVYEAEFGCWCPKGRHKMGVQYPYVGYCTEHGCWNVYGYRLINEKGKEDIWGYWNFEIVGVGEKGGV